MIRKLNASYKKEVRGDHFQAFNTDSGGYGVKLITIPKKTKKINEVDDKKVLNNPQSYNKDEKKNIDIVLE